MYEEFFGFAAPPFRLNPDPKFFFGSRSHNKAMAYLHYGLRQGEGFIVITGEIGAGKSMLISHLLDQLDRSNVVAAHLLTANLEPSALMAHILSAFRIEAAGKSESAAHEAFEDFLFDQMNRGRRVLLIVDEAQNLPMKTIEELRMLSNMDYDGTPLFQVFLIGQPEFRGILSKPNMEQFRQRVIASYHLEPLNEAETTEYIRHRLALVGWANDPAISDEAFTAIFEASGGVPRKINKLCNRILLFSSLEKRHTVDAELVGAVVEDLRQESFGASQAFEDDAADSDEAAAGRAVSAKLPAKEDAVREEPRRAVASGGRVEARATDGGEEDRTPVVIPFDNSRRNGSKDVRPAEEASASEKPRPPTQEKKSKRLSTEDQASVLDRLRAQRAALEGVDDEEAIATLDTAISLREVAKAIEEASAAQGASLNVESEAGEDDAEASVALEPLGEPALGEDPNGWRRSVVSSIDETRDELKAAHQSVSRLRRRLSEIDKKRIERRQQIAANLTRAQSLLADIKKAWR